MFQVIFRNLTLTSVYVVHFRAYNGSMGRGSWVNWVAISCWVTWVVSGCWPMTHQFLKACAITSGKFRRSLKNSTISSLLKTQSSQGRAAQLSSSCPLSFISKTIERAAKTRLTDHLSINNLLDANQSAYCKTHFTETALLYIHDRLINAICCQEFYLVCLLDLYLFILFIYLFINKSISKNTV